MTSYKTNRGWLALALALTLVSSLSAASLAAAQDDPSLDEAAALLDRARQRIEAEAPLTSLFRYDIDYRDDDIQARGQVDPSRPPGQRITVLSPPQDSWSDDFRQMLTELDSDPEDSFWCSNFVERLGTDARVLAQTPEQITYVFRPQPGPDDNADDRKFLSNMSAKMTIHRGSGAVDAFEMWNRRPFKPIFIAKIRSFNLSVACAPAPDGRRYAARVETSLSAKVALKKIEEQSVREVSNLRAARW